MTRLRRCSLVAFLSLGVAFLAEASLAQDVPPIPSKTLPEVGRGPVLRPTPQAPVARRRTTGPTMRAHFIDVGQGACTLLEFPCGAVLIDTGGQDDTSIDALVQYLTAFFDDRRDLNGTIDLVLVTHPHIDHTRGLRRVVETFTVRNYVDDGATTGSGLANVRWIREQVEAGELATTIRPVRDSEIEALPHRHGLTDESIDPVSCDNCDPKIVVLSGGMDDNPGWSRTDFNNLNNHSLVTRVDFGETSFLFTGDLETPASQTLVAYYRHTPMLDVDIYQVGHHGSSNGTTEAFLEASTPEIAVIGCGDWSFGADRPNDRFTTFAYGHPRLSIIQRLSQFIPGNRPAPILAGVFERARHPGAMMIQKNIHSTSWDGTVLIEADLRGRTVITGTTQKPAPRTPLRVPPAPDEEDDLGVAAPGETVIRLVLLALGEDRSSAAGYGLSFLNRLSRFRW